MPNLFGDPRDQIVPAVTQQLPCAAPAPEPAPEVEGWPGSATELDAAYQAEALGNGIVSALLNGCKVPGRRPPLGRTLPDGSQLDLSKLSAPEYVRYKRDGSVPERFLKMTIARRVKRLFKRSRPPDGSPVDNESDLALPAPWR